MFARPAPRISCDELVIFREPCVDDALVPLSHSTPHMYQKSILRIATVHSDKSALPDGADHDAPKSVRRLLVCSRGDHQTDRCDPRGGLRVACVDPTARREFATSRWSSTRRPATGRAAAPRPRSTCTSTTSAKTCAAESEACSTNTTKSKPHHRAPPAAQTLQAVLPGHGLDPTARGRTSAVIGTASNVSSL
jgi:hypothetical protein